MKFTFTLNQAGVDEVARSPGVRQLVERNADRVLAEARSIAPVDTGDYRDSLKAEPAKLTSDGWRADVVSTSWKWHFVEFGTPNNPAHHVLERAVTGAGLKFEEG